MPKSSAQVTAAEISRIADVTRATVSNWRRRYEDFPAPAGGTESSPLYDLAAVSAWLKARNHPSVETPSAELRTTLRLHPAEEDVTTRLVPLVLAASRKATDELAKIAELDDADLLRRAAAAASKLREQVPDADKASFSEADAPVIRALIRCVRDGGAKDALDVLATRGLDTLAAPGTYETPEGLGYLMARFLPESTESVLDPTCGAGTLLASATERGARQLYGQDLLPVQAQRSAVRLLLTDSDAEVTVRAGDSLLDDAFPDLTVDAVLCSPPHAVRDWGHEELLYDPRWTYGVPPRNASELAWVQHALAHLEPAGYAVLLLTPTIASRSSGRQIRAELVRSGALRAVVGLPAGVAEPLHIPLHLWILQRPEPGGAQPPSVLFIDTAAGEEGETWKAKRGSARLSVAWDALAKTALRSWSSFTEAPAAFADEPGVARAVAALDLLDDDVDLTPARQVRLSPGDIDPQRTADSTARSRATLLGHINTLTRLADYEDLQAVESPRDWRTATLSDLSRGGAVSIQRGAGHSPKETRGKHDETPESTRSVFTGRDIAMGTRASGTVADTPIHAATAPVVKDGDVLLRTISGGSGLLARVADADDAGSLVGHHLVVVRPDPGRIDAWFLAGFLTTEANFAGATTGVTVANLQPTKLRVPLLPLAEQRRYGAAFRRVHDLRIAARGAADAAEKAAQDLLDGLTSGALHPTDTPTEPTSPPSKQSRRS
ncbi:N-6 DNA methylase [Streptomyces monticola]|uniref:N-6 DNA methylase n=1 Tax=Streptomyces monticola TaxID=2666263 RepID=A0ABW2JLT1_9ACTN